MVEPNDKSKDVSVIIDTYFQVDVKCPRTSSQGCDDAQTLDSPFILTFSPPMTPINVKKNLKIGKITGCKN